MTCAEFLNCYTDFRDGLVTAPREVRRFTRHLAQCPSCRRYDATLRRGVKALQASDSVQPSADFRRRLERRLREEGLRRGPVLPALAGVAAALFVAVGIALLTIEGVRRHQVAQVPVLPAVPFPEPVARAGVPFVSFQDPRSSVVFGNPTPYGTVIVQPAAAER